MSKSASFFKEIMQVLPNTWVLKLRDMRRKSQKQQQPPAAEAIDQVQGSAGRESCPATTDHFAGGDPMSFVCTALRTSRQSKQSPIRVFSSPVSWHGSTDNLHGVVEPRCKSPVNHKVFDIPYPNASPGKNLMRTPSPRRSTAASSVKTPTLLKAVSKRDQDPLAFGRREADPQPVESSLQSSAKPPLMIRSSAPVASNFSSSPGPDSEDGLDFTTAPREVAALSTGAFRKTAQSRVQRNSSTVAPRVGRTRHGSMDMDSLEVSAFALDRALKEFNSMGVTGLKLAAKSSSRGDRKESKPRPAQEKKIQDEWTEELSRGALVKQQLFLKKRAALKLQLDDTQSWKQLELRSLSAMQQSWDSEDNDLQAGILVMQEPPHTQSKLLTLPSCLTLGWDNADDDDPQTVFDPDDSIECTRRKLLNKFNDDDDDDDDDSSSFALLHQAAEEAAASCCGSFSSSLPTDESIFTSSYNLAGDVKNSFPKKSFCSTSSDSSGITSTSGEFEEDLVLEHWNAATSDALSSDDMSSAASKFENRKAAKLFRAASCRLSREKSPRFLEEAAEAIQLESCLDSDVTEERLSDSERPEVPGNRIERFDSPGSFKSSTISSRDFNRFNMTSRAAVCKQEALAKKTWVVPVHKRQGKSVGSSCDLRTRGTSHIMQLNSSAAALSAADHEATPVSSSAATARKHPARSRAKRLYEIDSQLETARRKKSASRRKSNKLCHRELTRSKSQSADHSYLKTASLAADPVQMKSEAMSKSETWVSHKQLETTAAAAAAAAAAEFKTTNPNSSNALPRLLQEQNNLDPKQQQEQQLLVHNRRSNYLQSRCKGEEEEEEEEELVTMPEELNGVVKESVALVKSSYNPYNDFKESMIEMIVEKDIQQSRDLEELLQCYLSLNAVEYHALIVEVFTEVWCEIFESLQP